MLLTEESFMSHHLNITSRDKLDFQLDETLPRHWFGGDPFKTRYFDAMSISFPDGERFFMMAVRAFKDNITDPALLEEIKEFNRQEGQHGVVHARFNDLLRHQGIDVDKLLRINRYIQFEIYWKYFTKSFNLAATAALEHLTATMVYGFFDKSPVMASADPRVRAMYAWHAIEELEHKAVAFDVMQKGAGVGYVSRCLAMVISTFNFTLQTLLIANYMLKVDGFSRWQRVKIVGKGLGWLYGRQGVFTGLVGHFLSYFKPGFHPNKVAISPSYQRWTAAFEHHQGDPIAAGNALY
ncbi:MAG: metal-dependent hydrolase [Rubrivivax sp.]|nr:MAG: metal-dependent hydrolase [Rubrivivax sp.]